MLSRGLIKEYSQLFTLILTLLDMAAILGAGTLAFFWKFNTLSLPLHYLIALVLVMVLVLPVFHLCKAYALNYTASSPLSLVTLLQATFALFIAATSLAFITKTGADYSRMWFGSWFLLSLLCLYCFRSSFLLLLKLMRQYGWQERYIILIGANSIAQKMIATLEQSTWTGFKIVAIFDDNMQGVPDTLFGLPVQKTPADLSGYLSSLSYGVDEVWLALPLKAEDRVKEILHQLRLQAVTTRYLLDIFSLDLLNPSIGDIAGIPVLNIRSTPMIGLNQFLKALEDRALAAIILLLISPLLLGIALGVRLTSKGPIFYRQRRVGWNGKEFEMLKFRTMPVDAESKSGPVWANKEDKRPTRLGKFLRSTSLDELPQFFNVLNGSMSIVGPRPERAFFVEQFKDQIPGYMQKHMVKAGITGWAQVNGWRGDTNLQKRIECDLYYIENWSLAFDLKIILLTFLNGFINKNAY